ncbi:Ribosome biogenesis protein ENP2 [Fulvia fulva]|uniref:Ribosome biogenesis protein ENP2 n=1 Tax=Passalora fulva TaxID=5499 RepID=A0A9Q8P3E2_PASFU|nr:Ribosome biogenesis protein ENP2 [Fulvia fulva]KAK4636739.1 Ribosome biogenesis protein ENP2 [Fulvia fulva]UJO11612.1 Ribosome biogenesis protein ENP2 [Fulvia fulva]
MKLNTHGKAPVYTIAGASTARPLPEWLARKRKRSLKKDAEYANRVELLQDFGFEEASQCVRVSEDGEWVMSTGTYKPQIHVHYLPHLSLSYARHTNTVNETFIILSSDYSKSLHLQTDRFLEFHTPAGLHYTTRIPRYGRDLKYNRRTAEALVPAVGVNADGNGEVFRLNLDVGRFMKGYEVDVGGDDMDTFGGGALQGGINTGSVNCAAIAEESHGLLAFGTSLGTVECWDSRSRNRVAVLTSPRSAADLDIDARPEITALAFDREGLDLATGSSNGIVRTYDIRQQASVWDKQQGYDYAIQTLSYLNPPYGDSTKLLSADKKGIKIWEAESGEYWTGVEPAVDLNHVEWVPDSGMLLTANEGRQQHSFFIPQLGPAPKWCAFLDNLVDEMAEDPDDPNAFKTSGTAAGEVYDNYKFLDTKQLRDLSLDHLIGTTNLLRPYMHGYFVDQKLYEQARLLTNPDIAEQQRQKSIQEKINKERESRIRGTKKVAVKVNRKYAEKLAAQEEANEKRKAQRVLRQGGDEPAQKKVRSEADADDVQEEEPKGLVDDRFKALFESEDFEIDETSREFAMHNASTAPSAPGKKTGLTAVEEEELDDSRARSSDHQDDDESEAEAPVPRRKPDELADSKGRIGSTSYKKSGKRSQEQRQGPTMQVSSSNRAKSRPQDRRNKSFGDLAATNLPAREKKATVSFGDERPFGEKEVTFAPSKPQKKSHRQQQASADDGRKISRGKERRSASGNVFRRM